MTLTVLELLSLLGAPLLLGVGLLHAIGLSWRDDRLAFGAWAVLTGGLGTGTVLFLLALLELPLRASLAVPLVLACALGAAWLGRRRACATPIAPPLRGRRWPWIEELFFAVVLLALLHLNLGRVARATLRFYLNGDEVAIWGLKGMHLFEAGGLNTAYRDLTNSHVRVQPQYPLLNPLLQLWAFVHAGKTAIVEARFPVQVFALAMIPALGAALRRIVRPGLAAFVLAMVLTTNQMAEQTPRAAADQMVALGVLVAVDAGLRWRASGRAAFGRLAVLALAVPLWTKMEGNLYLAAFVVTGGTLALLPRLRGEGPRPSPPDVRAALRGVGPLALLWPAILAATWALNARFGFSSDLATAQAPDLLTANLAARVPVLADVYARFFFARPLETAYLFAALLVVLVLAPARALSARLGPLTVYLLVCLAGLSVVYLSSPYDMLWHIANSLRRVTFQMLPVAGLWIATALAADPWLGPGLRGPT